MSNEREKWIDNAKGIAMILVIIGHVSGGLEGIWNFNFVYGIHLVMFFVLSGYTTKKKELTPEFLSNRFERLMGPYFITCVAILITDVINSYIAHDSSIATVTNIIRADLVRSFFASGAVTQFGAVELGTRIGAIWFLPAMFFGVIFFQLILKYFENRDGVSGIVSAWIAILGYVSARFIWLPFSIQPGMMATFFLWIGYMIRKKHLLSHIKWYHYIVAQVILLLGIYKGYCDVGFVVAYINDWIISIIVGLSGCLLIYLCSILDKGKILEYIGKNSLIVLCTHLYALEALGVYFNKFLDKCSLQGNVRVWILIISEVLFAVLLAFIIERVTSWVKQADISSDSSITQESKGKRDVTVDVVKGILIVSMLIGHFAINNSLRTIIYSCHMIAFVFLSGYFYKASRSPLNSLKKMVKSFLGPYMIFVCGVFLLNVQNWNVSYFKNNLIKYLLGISFSKNILSNVESVGPVYFILLLFVVRVVYIIIDKLIKSESGKWCATIVISLLGVYLGDKGYWLPWSIDVALYCVIFYKLGLACNEKGVVEFVKNNHYVYFLISPIWAYMIYSGGMEIAVRRYGQYGLVVVGSVMGVLTIYIFADYITKHVPLIGEMLRTFGQDSIIIIIIHTLLSGKIGEFISLRFNPDYFTFMFLSILVQLVLAVIVKFIISFVKKRVSVIGD